MKNKIKTLLLIVLAGMMLITLTGCGKEDNESKEEEKVDLGKWNENVYTNEYLGMKITLPEGWTAATDEQIAKLMNIGEEVLKDEGKYMSEVAKQTSRYYASATEDATGSGIIVMSEKTPGATLDDYVKALKTQLTSMTQMSYKVTHEGEAKLSGTTWSTLTLTETTYGVAQIYYVCEKDGSFVGIILTSSNGEEKLDTIAKFFE